MSLFSMTVRDIDIEEEAMLSRWERVEIAPLRKAGLLVEREAKISMAAGGKIKVQTTNEKTGKTRTRVVSRPSTPPAPPNVQSGVGRSSITTAFVTTPTGFTALVGPTNVAFYMGHIHERGGEFGGRHYPARPFMVPALSRVQNQFPELFRGVFR